MPKVRNDIISSTGIQQHCRQDAVLDIGQRIGVLRAAHAVIVHLMPHGKNICSEYGQYNIQCNGLGPGYIETPQTAPLREVQPDGSRHPFDQFICAKTPANRWLKGSSAPHMP